MPVVSYMKGEKEKGENGPFLDDYLLQEKRSSYIRKMQGQFRHFLHEPLGGYHMPATMYRISVSIINSLFKSH